MIVAVAFLSITNWTNFKDKVDIWIELFGHYVHYVIYEIIWLLAFDTLFESIIIASL